MPSRFDHILNLSGEIGLVRTRLNCLVDPAAKEQSGGRRANVDPGALAAARKDLPPCGAMDALVADLQNVVMKARMQPVGRVVPEIPAPRRDLGRQLARTSTWNWWRKAPKSHKTILDN